MSTRSSEIEWCDSTWNPVRGCSRVSDGCRECFAMKQAHRFSGPGKPYDGLTTIRRGKVDWSGQARLVTKELAEPLRWRKPQRIFVNSMSDLFHHSLSDEDIDSVFGVMWACLYLGRDAYPGHTFQVLTKRPERMLEYLSSDRRQKWASKAAFYGGGEDGDAIHDQVVFHKGPHPRIWLGVSVENQATADERIPLLQHCPAAVRFISAEPLLDAVDLSLHLQLGRCRSVSPAPERFRCGLPVDHEGYHPHSALTESGAPWFGKMPLDWVIVGGESGSGARPFELEWARSVVKQCRDAGVSCFVKQLGSVPMRRIPEGQRVLVHLRDRKGGDILEWPVELCVRQFPEAHRER